MHYQDHNIYFDTGRDILKNVIFYDFDYFYEEKYAKVERAKSGRSSSEWKMICKMNFRVIFFSDGFRPAET